MKRKTRDTARGWEATKAGDVRADVKVIIDRMIRDGTLLGYMPKVHFVAPLTFVIGDPGQEALVALLADSGWRISEC